MTGPAAGTVEHDPGGGPDPIDTDGGGRPDGGMAGSPDAGRSDAGGQTPDAAPSRDVCPQPCAGDAVYDFYTDQGGANGRWRYIEVQPEGAINQYVDMFAITFPGAIVGWSGTGTPAPTIAFCYASESAPCTGLSEVLALTTTSNAVDAHRPALAWTAPATGVYYMSGTWRVSSTAPAVETTMRVTQNGELFLLQEIPVTLTDVPSRFELELSLVQGDRIVLSAVASGGEPVSVGVDLFYQGPF